MWCVTLDVCTISTSDGCHDRRTTICYLPSCVVESVLVTALMGAEALSVLRGLDWIESPGNIELSRTRWITDGRKECLGNSFSWSERKRGVEMDGRCTEKEIVSPG